jgi:post-segregation antitoxin (ccd killing protein)
MARINVYLPDDLASEARAAGLNISRITQDALRAGLAQSQTDRWLDRLDRMPQARIAHEHVIAALDDARTDFGHDDAPGDFGPDNALGEFDGRLPN